MKKVFFEIKDEATEKALDDVISISGLSQTASICQAILSYSRELKIHKWHPINIGGSTMFIQSKSIKTVSYIKAEDQFSLFLYDSRGDYECLVDAKKNKEALIDLLGFDLTSQVK